MRKLLNRKITEQNGICPICDEKFSDYRMLFRITNDAKGWEEHGEMTTQTISKPHTGGAMEKKSLPGLKTDGPSAGRSLVRT